MLTRRTVRENLKGRFWRGGSRSQGMVEFAIAAPILLMLIFGIIDFSLLFSAWLLVQNIARQAVRYAVTGQFDVAHCPVGGCLTQADEDEARLQSIYDEANSFRAGLIVEDGASQSEPMYLKITVCTGAPYVTILPRMGSTQYGECTPAEHPGEPGHPVIVMVDFNHPYITPILNEVWPMVHLASYHEGIVEQFRISRLVNLPPEIQLPTSTPLPATQTFTPSDTSTITDTPTATPSWLPIYLEIIEPYMDGLVYTSYDQTLFEAVSYDSNIGTNNGDGIARLTFSFTGPGPNGIPSRSEAVQSYCAFGGDGPCSPMTQALFDSLTNSNLYNNANDYYMTVTAYTPDGRTATAVVRFKIMKPTPTPTSTGTNTRTPTASLSPTITRTPTKTLSPTMTPTFSCSQFTFTTGFAQTTANSRPRVTISVRNGTTYYTVNIQSWTLDWSAYDASNPSQSYRRWYVGSTLIDSTSDANSSTSWSGSPSSALALGPGVTSQLRFDFVNVDAAWPGIVPASSFGLTLTLDNGCVLAIGAQPTPTRTNTPTFTRTFTRTNTVPSPTPTNTVPTPTYTRTYTPTNTVPTPTPTNTVPTPTRTSTRTSTRTFTPTNTVPTPTRTNTVPTPTRTSTRTSTRTFTPTNTVPTPTYTLTFTRTNTSTFTSTWTWTFTPSSTFTPTISLTPTRTFTRTPTNTVLNTPTATPTRSPTPSNTYCFDC